MEVFVENTFGNYLIQFLNYFITYMANFWKIVSYEFFTISLEWINDFFGFELGGPIYFYDLPVSFITIGTSGLLFFLLIHIAVLIKDLFSND